MLQLLMLVMAAAGPGGGSLPENHMILREVGVRTPVTDKDLRPVKPRDCRTVAEVQRTLEQLKAGEAGECFIRDRTAFRSR